MYSLVTSCIFADFCSLSTIYFTFHPLFSPFLSRASPWYAHIFPLVATPLSLFFSRYTLYIERPKHFCQEPFAHTGHFTIDPFSPLLIFHIRGKRERNESGNIENKATDCKIRKKKTLENAYFHIYIFSLSPLYALTKPLHNTHVNISTTMSFSHAPLRIINILERRRKWK